MSYVIAFALLLFAAFQVTAFVMDVMAFTIPLIIPVLYFYIRFKFKRK